MGIADKLNEMLEQEKLQPEVNPPSFETESPEAEQHVEAVETQTQFQEAEPQAPVAEETAPMEEIPAQEWAPSLKFKVLKEEHEFPEWSREFVKSKEIEDQFVDLFTKANALEHQKKRRGEIEDNFAKLQSDYDSKMSDARQLAEIVSQHNQRISSNDPKEQLLALQNAGLSEKGLLDIARHVLDLQRMDPSQRQAYDQQFQQREQLTQYQRQLSQTNESLQAAQQQAARAELTSFLSTKRDMMNEYEARDGNNEGDFQQDFINFGVALQSKLGQEIEWKDAMKQFKKVHGLGKPKSKPAPKVLPNLRSIGHSPIEKDITSMDDIRKRIGLNY